MKKQTHLSKEDRSVARRLLPRVTSKGDVRTDVGEEVRRLIAGKSEVGQNQEEEEN